MKWMIEKSAQEMGSVGQGNKHTHLHNLQQIVGFCYEPNECRRAMLLRHFGEAFNTQLCNKTCDNCRKGSNELGESRDVTEVSVLQLSCGDSADC